ncbi:hypothetical protein IMG5_154510 [Ichthyophthirius multifiliis]|uniref:Uncharacterized protein n=1 Tax=Ichthyophthirius multifiliis TaxID=5932 RepID=G0QZ54_ICHMU|nr:hypothetical protein IMG5_154510 [Ichthyophthirius multifiliis]EGR29505.1 hypothetical protein IMG5_154510 [Ichthyophthirius multifiliis]|eukprot:XP_004030741.1 hypothetical protein IMG5_154510 [Ichthyophthirius multifiliis]
MDINKKQSIKKFSQISYQSQINCKYLIYILKKNQKNKKETTDKSKIGQKQLINSIQQTPNNNNTSTQNSVQKESIQKSKQSKYIQIYILNKNKIKGVSRNLNTGYNKLNYSPSKNTPKDFNQLSASSKQKSSRQFLNKRLQKKQDNNSEITDSSQSMNNFNQEDLTTQSINIELQDKLIQTINRLDIELKQIKNQPLKNDSKELEQYHRLTQQYLKQIQYLQASKNNLVNQYNLEVIFLQQQITEMQTRLQKQRENIYFLEQENSNLFQQIQEGHFLVKDEQNQSYLDTKLDYFNQQLKLLQEQIKLLTVENKELQLTNENYKQIVEEMQIQSRNLLQENDNLKEAISESQQKISEENESIKRTKKHDEKIEILQEQMRQYELENQDLQNLNNLHKKTIRDLEQLNYQIQQKNEQYQNQLQFSEQNRLEKQRILIFQQQIEITCKRI